MITAIAFDGDDTLWHNETIFSMTQAHFIELLDGYADQQTIHRHLIQAERANLLKYGYGVKGFILSMIETAIDLTDGRIGGNQIRSLIDCGKEMLAHPVELLDGAEEAVTQLAGKYRLLLITKGDLFHQESKVARSGLADRFDAVEIVSEKDEPTYRRILDRHGIDPNGFVMVGNSIKSDILPVLGIGGHGVHVPYHTTWELEQADPPTDHYRRIDSLHALAGMIADW